MCRAIECNKYGQVSRTFDNLMNLSVKMPQKAIKQFQGVEINLSKCLEQFVKTERLEGCGYKFENAKKKIA